MWIFTRYGFFSIACASQFTTKGLTEVNPTLLMVRSRSREHLEQLMRAFPELEAEVHVLPNRDYRFRNFVDKQVWATVMAKLALEQTWSNFKDEAYRFNPKDLAYEVSLHSVWEIMARMPYRKLTKAYKSITSLLDK